MHTYLSCTGHCIISSSLSIFPNFLILPLDPNSNFYGAAACLMQFRLLRLGGRAAPRQVAAETGLHECTARFSFLDKISETAVRGFEGIWKKVTDVLKAERLG